MPGQDPKRPNLSSGKLKAHQSMHMSLAGTNLSNEQPETGRVIALSGHAARRCGRQVCSIRFMVPMHAKKRKGAFHEPAPLPAFGHPLPALRGEGRERGAYHGALARPLARCSSQVGARASRTVIPPRGPQLNQSILTPRNRRASLAACQRRGHAVHERKNSAGVSGQGRVLAVGAEDKVTQEILSSWHEGKDR